MTKEHKMFGIIIIILIIIATLDQIFGLLFGSMKDYQITKTYYEFILLIKTIGIISIILGGYIAFSLIDLYENNKKEEKKS